MKRLAMIFVMGCAAAAVSVASSHQKQTPIDIQASANQKLVDNLGTGAQGNNLKELPVGEQLLGGVTFKVGEGLIQLASKVLDKMPEKVEGIKVDRKLVKLRILHATCFGGGPSKPGDPWFVEDDTPIGDYRVNFEDKSVILVPIVYGQDVRDWFYVEGEKDPSRSKIVWKGENERATLVGARIRLYMTTWENPSPAKRVTTIDYLSKKDQTVAAPFCVAITAEAP